MNKFWNTQANLPLISLITLEVPLKLYKLLRTVAAIVAGSACKITWKSVENWLRYQRKTGKNDDKNAQRSVKTHCRQWVCGHCDCLGISLIFRLTTFDVRIRRQKSSNSANRVFYISLNKGYFGKAIFSRLFSARYHILKKKKKTILGLCRCSVDNYSLNPGDLPCQF